MGEVVTEIKKEFKKFSNQERAELLQRYFKTGKGEYGEGDIFLGLRVSDTRKIAKKYNTISIGEAAEFLPSQYHEERLFALLVLINIFQRGNEEDRKKIFDLYLQNTNYINNWDLVDVSAGKIVGACLFNHDRAPISKLAKSRNLWERRISIMATSYFIKHNSFDDTFNITEILLHDKDDLIHKAVGWMLREIGKRELEIEEEFLKKYYKEMPRTMLRYAIEKFPEEKRKSYLKK